MSEMQRVIEVDRERLVAYAAASGDQNPIHQDADIARSVGLPDVIAHGMWTMGAALEVVTDWAGGDPGRIASCSTKFTRPVVVPEVGATTVQVTGDVVRTDETTGDVTVELSVTCRGEKVLGRCQAVVRG